MKQKEYQDALDEVDIAFEEGAISHETWLIEHQRVYTHFYGDSNE